MDWDKLRIFHAVATAGSLTKAGETLHLSQSAVSRHVSGLEESLATTLFHRHARGLILTEQGELLYDASKSISQRLEIAAARIRDSKDRIFGELRVTTSIGFGTLWLAPRLSALYEKYPQLSIDLMLEERVLDLPMREADFAIRMKEPSQSDVVRRKLMTIRMRLYASDAYLTRWGTPESMEELSNHRLIFQGLRSEQISAGATLLATILKTRITAHLTVNNYYGVLQGVLHDVGIGLLPDYLKEHFPALVRVLPQVESTEIPVFLAYPLDLRNSKRVHAFRDFIIDEVKTYRAMRKTGDTDTGHS